jgi:hypothetical protein
MFSGLDGGAPYSRQRIGKAGERAKLAEQSCVIFGVEMEGHSTTP